jgi:ubiquinone biosynthesis O-methyltransferase
MRTIPLHHIQQDQQRQSPSRRAFSVAAAEVEKFGAMQADWWNPRKNPLISMNAIRVPYIVQQVVKTVTNSLRRQHGQDQSPAAAPLQGWRAVDIGCGGGLLSESLVRLGADQVTGIDPSVDLLSAAQTHADSTLTDPKLRGRLDYRNTTGEDLADQVASGKAEAYDMVCLLEVIEHVRHPESLLEAASKLLRPGGLLFVSTMNRTFKSHCLTIVGAEYIMGYLPRGTHDWNLYRSPAEVRQLVEASGLREVDTSGMVLKRPPLLSFVWALDPTDTDVNWIGTYVKN